MDRSKNRVQKPLIWFVNEEIDQETSLVETKSVKNSVLVRFGSYYENSPRASGFFLILKFNSNLPKKTEV